MNNRLVLINPTSPFLLDDTVFPPLGLLYLAGKTKATVVDLAISSDIPKADIYGITATTPQINEAVSISQKLDGIKILGGAHISATRILPESFDIGVIGPGERVLSTMDFSFRGLKIGSFIPIKPNRNCIELQQYHYYIDSMPATSMMTSFGCPFKCAFCSKPVFEHLVYQCTEIVYEEIDDIKNLGFDAVMIFDDNFLLHPSFKLISQKLKEKSMIYRCFVQTRFVNEDTARWLHQTGCKEVGIGVESGSEKILKIINKPATTAENLQAIRLLKKYYIRVKGFIIVGLPFETEETLAATEDFLEKAELDDIDVTIFTPYPKSPIWENREKFKIDWNIEDYQDCWYKGIPGRYNPIVDSLPADIIRDKRSMLEGKYKNGKEARRQDGKRARR